MSVFDQFEKAPLDISVLEQQCVSGKAGGGTDEKDCIAFFDLSVLDRPDAGLELASHLLDGKAGGLPATRSCSYGYDLPLLR